MEMLYNELSKVLTEIVRNVLSKPFIIYHRPSSKISSLDEKSFSFEGYKKPDYFISAVENSEGVLKLYDFINLDNLLMQNYPYLLNPFQTYYGSGNFSRERLIEVLLANIFSRLNSNSNYVEVVQEVLNEFIAILKNKSIEINIYFPINNLSVESDFEQTSFGKGFVLKKLSEEEINNLFLDREFSDGYERIARYSIVFTTETELFNTDGKSLYVDNDSIVDKEMTKLVHALNLTISGSLGIETQHILFDNYFMYFIGNRETKSHKRIIGSAHTLSINDIEKWRDFYTCFSNINYPSFLFALNKLNESEIRLELQDSIIDAVIGTEYLLLNDIGNETTRGEMRYRFSINYASLFDEIRRKEAFQKAVSAYDLRSAIVHGGKINIDKIKYGDLYINLYEAKRNIIEMLRTCIITLLTYPINNNFYTQGFWLNKVLLKSI